MTVRTCILCGNDIGTGEGFHLGTGVNREVAKHATCLAVWTWRARAEKAEAEVERLSTHVEELQAEALDIQDGGPPEGTTTGGAILAIRAVYTRAEKAEAEVTRLRASAVVWADDASPFTGEQVKALLDENERLRRALREIEAVARNHNEDWITRLAYEAQRSTSARKDSDG